MTATATPAGVSCAGLACAGISGAGALSSCGRGPAGAGDGGPASTPAARGVSAAARTGWPARSRGVKTSRMTRMLSARCVCMGSSLLVLRHVASQIAGPEMKDQGARVKDQGSRKDQGPRSKDQGPRSKGQGRKAKDQGQKTKDLCFSTLTSLLSLRITFHALRSTPPIPPQSYHPPPTPTGACRYESAQIGSKSQALQRRRGGRGAA